MVDRVVDGLRDADVNGLVLGRLLLRVRGCRWPVRCVADDSIRKDYEMDYPNLDWLEILIFRGKIFDFGR